MSDPRHLPRRAVLGLGAAAAAFLAGYPVVRQLRGYPEPEVALVHLTPMAATVFRILGDFVVPPGPVLPGSGGDTITLRRIDRLLGQVPEETRRLLLALPLAFEHGTAIERYGARALSSLEPDRQRAYLREWAESDDLIRAQLFMAYRSLLGMAYFERADVMAAMGIGSPCGPRP